jgi:hypothetical protein
MNALKLALMPYLFWIKLAAVVGVVIFIWSWHHAKVTAAYEHGRSDVLAEQAPIIQRMQETVIRAQQGQADARAQSKEYRDELLTTLGTFTGAITGSLHDVQNQLRAGVLSSAMEAYARGSSTPEIAAAIGEFEAALGRFSAGVGEASDGCGKDAAQLGGVIRHAESLGAIE